MKLYKKSGSKDKEVHSYKITFLRKSAKSSAEVFDTFVINATSEFSAWSMAYETFGAEYPTENPEYFDIEIKQIANPLTSDTV